MAEEIITATNQDTATDHEYGGAQIQGGRAQAPRHVYRLDGAFRPAPSGV